MVDSVSPDADPNNGTTTPHVASSDRLLAVEQQLGRLEEELRVRGGEIDKLQAAETRTPWFRQATTIVAIAAFGFSLISGGFGLYLQNEAERRADAADERAIAAEERAVERENAENLAELRAILQRLSAIAIETDTAYSQSSPQAGRAREATNERTLLIGQAEIILKRLPDDYVSAAEYNALAGSMLQLPGTHEKALDYFNTAYLRADNLNDALTAVRSIASIAYAEQQYDEMRARYRESLELLDKHSLSPFWRSYMETETRLLWAASEVNSAHCAAGNEQVTQAYNVGAALLPWQPVLNTQYTDLWQRVQNCQGT